MILTITANAALDRVLYLDEFRPGITQYTTKTVDCVGGKGFDASIVLQQLGVEQLALGFIAGETGKQVARLLDGYHIPHDLTWVEGDTRIAHVIVETNHLRHSHVTTTGYRVKPEEEARFLENYCQRLKHTSWVIAGGSLAPGLPASFYEEIARLAGEAGVKTIIDTSGDSARQVAGTQNSILKLNLHEFNTTFGQNAQTTAELCTAGQAVIRQYGLPALIVTCGKDGILVILPVQVLLAKSPAQAEINSAGAGDAVSAALAWRFALGDGWEPALHWAAAIASASVLTEATAEFHLEDMHRIYPEVTVQSL
ncbi:MAG: 1-phosphofructokinase family hexose kinase [Omnitrophica WOR_2 bacterium]